jgi:hypothetical protein
MYTAWISNLFICALLYDFASSSEYVALHDRMVNEQ